MKLLIPAAVFVMLFPAASFSQGLYFTILDSLDYNPTSLDVADFDGDGLDEIFAGSDTGLLVINPRTHGILYYSDNLRERVTASAFFDVDGDGAKDILVGTQQGGNWLNVIWGPGYGGYYRWQHYFNHTIMKIYTGILPDSSQIILHTNNDPYLTLVAVDPFSWGHRSRDCTHVEEPYNRCILAYSLNYIFHGPPPGYFECTLYLSFFNSSLESIYQTPICSMPEIFIQCYGAIAGDFWAPHSGYLVIPATWSPPATRNFYVYDGDFERVAIIADSDLGGIWTRVMANFDVQRDGIDELCFFGYHIRIYGGSDLTLLGDIPSGFNSVAKAIDAHLISTNYKTLLLQADSKLRIAHLSIYPVGINETSSPLPAKPSLSAYPNPFNAEVTLTLSGFVGEAEISIYDIAGRLVRKLAASGEHTTWDGRAESGAEAQSGVYFVRAVYAMRSVTTKIVLLK